MGAYIFACSLLAYKHTYVYTVGIGSRTVCYTVNSGCEPKYVQSNPILEFYMRKYTMQFVLIKKIATQ